MGDLTKNFSRREFECNPKLCGCGYDKISLELVKKLQQLRDYLGKPVKINSGCRCEKHNRNVGGAKNSFHLKGDAADIAVSGMTSEQLTEAANKSGAFEDAAVLTYPGRGFIHTDVRGYKFRKVM